MMVNFKTFISATSFIVIVIIATAFSSNTLADWNGYVNEKTLDDRPYGYLTSSSILSEYRKLRIVCFPADEYRLYLDESINTAAETIDVVLTVDQLPPPALTVQRNGTTMFVSNHSAGFWPLIAQMSAGAKLTVTTGNGPQYTYSLIGFTRSYLDNCGWMTSSIEYRAFLDRYR